ncbi:uncharacterized protein E0L32_000440 [Thyridium curvatum]|uniref:Uncharacterized protein n=1 Tax=Thyridium curvatum TaxID=1093900 RepID=A0A507B4N6_9PEZI|nr:uncharacterized protein E0L32_000440 [Thyridium curvatum]TPX14046.1 hypothetical protein E0L32_000440 [Thyridium curvatum]
MPPAQLNMESARGGAAWDDVVSWDPACWDPFDPGSLTIRGAGLVEYSKADCLGAIHGEKAPSPSQSKHLPEVGRIAVLRGIRHHPGFAEDLRGVGQCPEYARALNARAIMSNEIPLIQDPAHVPYCIWYPETASEETYRSVAMMYPQMRYQVGRACAVAGYIELYQELDLLPDLGVAEEARDAMRVRNCKGSEEIYNSIVSEPVRWQVMNDYTRSVALDNPTRSEYGLNGDTAIRSMLELRRKFDGPSYHHGDWEVGLFHPSESSVDELAPRYFNITEDWHIDEFSSVEEVAVESGSRQTMPDNSQMLELLWQPLPFDLPPGDKDVLILLAAYHGDVDRYNRLRRPVPVGLMEERCVIRGIYHNPLFAKWWSLQPVHLSRRYESAITARFIMTNDLSRVTEQTDDHDLPFQIWWPQRAKPETYLELARRKPSMKPAVARALLVADYQSAWDSLDFKPYHGLLVEARASPNPYYEQDLEQRCHKMGLSIDKLEGAGPASLEDVSVHDFADDTTTLFHGSLSVADFEAFDTRPGIYDGYRVDVSEAELYAVVPDELRPTDKFGHVDLGRLYFEQSNEPPNEKAYSEAYSPGGGSYRGRGRGRSSGVPWGRYPPRHAH